MPIINLQAQPLGLEGKINVGLICVGTMDAESSSNPSRMARMIFFKVPTPACLFY